MAYSLLYRPKVMEQREMFDPRKPLTPMGRLKLVLIAIFMGLLAILGFRYAPMYADPAFRPTGRWARTADWEPFWRGAYAAITATFFAQMAVVSLLLAVRRGKPSEASKVEGKPPKRQDEKTLN